MTINSDDLSRKAKLAVLRIACGIAALPEQELLAELERLFLAGAKEGRETMMPLYRAANAMMATLGSNGEIDARDSRTVAVMDALYEIDGGTPIAPPTEAHNV